MTRVEDSDILSDDKKIAETFNAYFRNIINTLSIGRDKSALYDIWNETDPSMPVIKTYSKHSSILRKRKWFKYSSEISFVPVDKDVI